MTRRFVATIALVWVGLAPCVARAESGGGALSLRWLGVAGFSISDGETVLLHDPYLSRPGLLTTLFSRYRPDAAVLERWLAPDGPAPESARARMLLIGHSHFDHLGDAAWIAKRLGARIAGSRTTVAIATGYGQPAELCRQVDPGDRFDVGAFEVRVVASGHAAVMLGRVPLTGEVHEPPSGPIFAASFKLGDARGHLLTHLPSGLRVYVLSSAGLDRSALEALHAEGVEVDVLLAATAGRDADYVPSLIELLRPAWVVPHHFDDFFVPIAASGAGDPSDAADLAAFEREVREAAARFGTGTRVRRLALFERFEFTPAEGRSGRIRVASAAAAVRR